MTISLRELIDLTIELATKLTAIVVEAVIIRLLSARHRVITIRSVTPPLAMVVDGRLTRFPMEEPCLLAPLSSAAFVPVPILGRMVDVEVDTHETTVGAIIEVAVWPAVGPSPRAGQGAAVTDVALTRRSGWSSVVAGLAFDLSTAISASSTGPEAFLAFPLVTKAARRRPSARPTVAYGLGATRLLTMARLSAPCVTVIAGPTPASSVDVGLAVPVDDLGPPAVLDVQEAP